MRREELIREWEKQDPLLEDLAGMSKFIEDRSPVNIIESLKPHSVFGALWHLCRVGELQLSIDEIELNVMVDGMHTEQFTVPISKGRIALFDINHAVDLNPEITNKLLTMLFEFKNSADRITIDMATKTIYVYCVFTEVGSIMSYEIDFNLYGGDIDATM